MEVNEQTLEELQPIFTYLNSHANKLYQEGYFLKLTDQDTQGRLNADRTWTECFAQLVGTVLSLWDAAELDAAGQDGEVLPKFINLTDASIKMIASLPANEAQPVQNVLSVSTAGKNRYLLHFNSHHSLIQWTAGIRLAMYEHTTLQEAYTGALIAGKGKVLNNIHAILERKRVKYEDWVRVRFGAGTPWRRCWCVVNPPDDKEYNKLQKNWSRNKSAYDRSRPPTLKGNVKFYESKKVTKKSRPIATITDAYSAYAIYPQSKSLIDSSTLVKLEGIITINSQTTLVTEGFVFVMPDVHEAVSGLEMMLRWLFPVFDTFALYGRPHRLVADVLDPRSLMFAMPKSKRYGYLEILDVSTLILQDGSQGWKEIEWRRKMKELTARRMATIMERGGSRSSRYTVRRNVRNSFRHGAADGAASIRSSPSVKFDHRSSIEDGPALPRSDTAPPGVMNGSQLSNLRQQHGRSVSEAQGFNRYENDRGPSRLDGQYGGATQAPSHQTFPFKTPYDPNLKYSSDMPSTPERVSSEDEEQTLHTPDRELHEMHLTSQPEPVALPPAFSHAPGSLPISKPLSSELRVDKASNTRAQISGANVISHAAGAVGHDQPNDNQWVHEIATIETSMNQAHVTPPVEGTAGIGATLPGDAEQTCGNHTQYSGHNQTANCDPATQLFYCSTSRHSIARKPVPTSSTPSNSVATHGVHSEESSSFNIDNCYNKSPGSYEAGGIVPNRLPVQDRNPDKPRNGVRKIAGDTELGTSNEVATGEPLVPDFDFGPVVSLARLQSPAEDAAAKAPRQPRQPTVPFYSAGAGTSASSDNVNKTMAWEPPSIKAAAGASSTLNPEQFAQRRPAGPSHTRQSSSTARRAMTPDSRLYESAAVLGDVYQKPYSKSTDNLVSRKPPPMNTGLVGAIGAREKEKQEMKQSVNSHAMRQALEKQQKRLSGSYEKRHSQTSFANFQPQYQQPQYYPAPQQYGGPSGPQAYTPMVQAPMMQAPMVQAQFPQMPAYGYAASPAEQQYQPQFPGQGVPHQGRGQGY